MRIACRWPGGMTLMLPGPGGINRIVRLDGPSGVKPVVAPVGAVSGGREVARRIQLSVLDAVDKMTETAWNQFRTRDYGVTDVPGDFWLKWYAIHADKDAVTKRIVFSLEN